jgi:hypothetical protein
MARIGDVVFDCAHPASLARFWAAALDARGDAPRLWFQRVPA